jgi:hypothetical protein
MPVKYSLLYAPGQPQWHTLTDVGRDRLSALRAFQHGALEHGSRRNQTQVVERYRLSCVEAGLSPFPPSDITLGQFYVAHYRRGNTPRSLPTLTSHVKRYCLEHDIPWLTDAQLLRLADVKVGMLKARPGNPRRAQALLKRHLDKLATVINPADHRHLQTSTMAKLGQAACFRLGELLSRTVGDITFEDNRLRIVASKMNKTGDPECVYLRDDGPSSPAGLFRGYWRALGGHSSPSSAPLWPDLRTPARSARTAKDFVQHLQQLSFFHIITGKPFLAYLAGYVHAWTFHTWAIQHSVRLGPLNSYTGLTVGGPLGSVG